MSSTRESVGSCGLCALTGHRSSGKTTLAEALLAHAGVLRTAGSTEEGTALLDHDPEERARHEGVFCASAWLAWQGRTLFVVDTPGGDAAVGPARIACAAIGFDLVVIHGLKGVESGTERVLNGARKAGRPVIAVLTHASQADPAQRAEIIEAVAVRLRRRGVCVWGEDGDGVVPLWEDKGRVHPDRAGFVESLALEDDELLERCLDQLEVTSEQLTSSLRASTEACRVVPVVAVDALSGLGIASLLDLLAHLLPSPCEADGVGTRIQHVYTGLSETDEPVAVFRVHQGEVKPGQKFFDARGARVAPTRWYQVRGPRRAAAKLLGTGALIATWERVSSRPGEFLDTQGPDATAPDLRPPMAWSLLVAQDLSEHRKLLAAFEISRSLDPEIGAVEEAGKLHVSAASPLVLERTIERVQKRWGVGIEVASVAVPYLEQPTHDVIDVRGVHSKPLADGALAYGEVVVSIEVDEVSKPVTIELALEDSELPERFHPALREGVEKALRAGVLSGYPVGGIRVRCTAADYDMFGTEDVHIALAAEIAVEQALSQAACQLLEPWEQLHLSVPGSDIGPYLAEVTQRRGRIEGLSFDDDQTTIMVACPYSELSMLGQKIHALSRGRAGFERIASDYRPIPAPLQASMNQGRGSKRTPPSEGSQASGSRVE